MFGVGARSSMGEAMLIERFRRRLRLYLLRAHMLIIAAILLSLHLRIRHGYGAHLGSHGVRVRECRASVSLVW